MVGQPGFFDVEERLRELSAKGDDLERIAVLVDFAMFRAELERAVPRSEGAKGGRPAFDHVLMFKILLLQAMHGLSEERCEYLIKDRLSFMRFLGVGLADPVPEANTIWAFREALKRAGAVERLFAQFDTMLRAAGYLAMGGRIVDATIVAAPKQRNTEVERAAIKAGQIPEGWAERPAKLRQKDRDARWTVKFSKAKPREDGAPQVDLAVPAFGYKNHIGIDRGHGLIRNWTATHAAAHDGARLEEVLDPGNTASGVWADTAYRSAKNEAMLARRGLVSRIHRKKPQGRPMPVLTRRANARRSVVRSAVEHVFARQKGPMGLAVRTIGIARASAAVTLANMAYSMKRWCWLDRRAVPARGKSRSEQPQPLHQGRRNSAFPGDRGVPTISRRLMRGGSQGFRRCPWGNRIAKRGERKKEVVSDTPRASEKDGKRNVDRTVAPLYFSLDSWSTTREFMGGESDSINTSTTRVPDPSLPRHVEGIRVKQKRILWVDDNIEDYARVVLNLQANFFSVRPEKELSGFFAALAAERFGAILLDFELEAGQQTDRILSAVQRMAPGTPIVFVTRYDQTKISAHFKPGSIEYFPKRNINVAQDLEDHSELVEFLQKLILANGASSLKAEEKNLQSSEAKWLGISFHKWSTYSLFYAFAFRRVVLIAAALYILVRFVPGVFGVQGTQKISSYFWQMVSISIPLLLFAGIYKACCPKLIYGMTTVREFVREYLQVAEKDPRELERLAAAGGIELGPPSHVYEVLRDTFDRLNIVPPFVMWALIVTSLWFAVSFIYSLGRDMITYLGMVST